MIRRTNYLKSIRSILNENPICALLGPRQCGKTTLAKQLASNYKNAHYFDLEKPTDKARLLSPHLSLEPLTGLVVIDEIQQQPELFNVLRPLADRRTSTAKFLILGSASPELIRGSSESLAGRVGFVDMSGLNLEEVGATQLKKLWLRGGFPRSLLSKTQSTSFKWRQDFIRTFLQRDIPQLGIRIPSDTLQRFWMMVAHYHAQIWNGAELARAFGVSEHTVRNYVDLLSGTFVLRQVPPWFENISKRQYKSPKVYVRDSGLLHALLGIETESELEGHPKYGASWEGFAMEQILSVAGFAQSFYWGTHAGAELDLLLFRGGRRYGVEFKTSDAPEMTKSMHMALQDLNLEKAWIVYPGKETYAVHERVEVVSLGGILNTLRKL